VSYKMKSLDCRYRVELLSSYGSAPRPAACPDGPGLDIVRLARRELVWINVTAYPTVEWCCGHALRLQARLPTRPEERDDELL